MPFHEGQRKNKYTKFKNLNKYVKKSLTRLGEQINKKHGTKTIYTQNENKKYQNSNQKETI